MSSLHLCFQVYSDSFLQTETQIFAFNIEAVLVEEAPSGPLLVLIIDRGRGWGHNPWKILQIVLPGPDVLHRESFHGGVGSVWGPIAASDVVGGKGGHSNILGVREGAAAPYS